MDEPITFKIGRDHKFRKTQRTSFRLSQAGVNLADLANPDKCFATLCHVLIALIDEPNVKMSAEDVAVAIEGREEEAVNVVNQCFGIDATEAEGKEKKPGAIDSPSSVSKSA